MAHGCKPMDVVERVLNFNYRPTPRRIVYDANLLNGRWLAYESKRVSLSKRDSKLLKLAYNSIMVRLSNAGLGLGSQPDARQPETRKILHPLKE